MHRCVVALIFAAIAISPAVGQGNSSGNAGRSMARSEPRTHRSARSEARNSSTSRAALTFYCAGLDARATLATCSQVANQTPGLDFIYATNCSK
jgi:hypothetical protein